jgi:hypothetical protein
MVRFSPEKVQGDCGIGGWELVEWFKCASTSQLDYTQGQR